MRATHDLVAEINRLRAELAKSAHPTTAAVVQLVARERERQDAVWGRSPGVWPDHIGIKLAVLVEEVGEVAAEVQMGTSPELLKAELVQVAAVACAIAETL